MRRLFRPPTLSKRLLYVWVRNQLVWRKLALPSVLGNLADPMLYMLGLGYGLGAMLPTVNGRVSEVVTDKGTIQTEIVVNASGLWGREVGKLVGLRLPVIPMAHLYLTTLPIEGVAPPERIPVDVKIPSSAIANGQTYQSALSFAYCTDKNEGLCVPVTLVWKLKIRNDPSASDVIELTDTVKPIH